MYVKPLDGKIFQKKTINNNLINSSDFLKSFYNVPNTNVMQINTQF